MTTNANGDATSSPDSRQKDELARGRKFSWDSIWNALGILIFLGCWILLGILIFNYLTGIGTPIILAVLAAIIGGFIAAVIAWFAGIAGIF